MIILSIETSCDETSIAVTENGKKILSNIIFSQIKYHQQFGGVVPELASRKHLEVITFVLKQSLKKLILLLKKLIWLQLHKGQV